MLRVPSIHEKDEMLRMKGGAELNWEKQLFVIKRGHWFW